MTKLNCSICRRHAFSDEKKKTGPSRSKHLLFNKAFIGLCSSIPRIDSAYEPTGLKTYRYVGTSVGILGRLLSLCGSVPLFKENSHNANLSSTPRSSHDEIHVDISS